MTPKVHKNFENLSGFLDGTPKYVSWPNLVKIGRCEVPEVQVAWFTKQKKLALRGTCPSPHFVQNGPIAPKISWTLSPLDMSAYTEFCPYRLRFAGLITERLIFRPKKSIQYYIRFHPTNTGRANKNRTLCFSLFNKNWLMPCVE